MPKTITVLSQKVTYSSRVFDVVEKLLEFPAGTLNRDEDPQEAAKRETAEETGFGAGQWVSLGTMYPAPGFCDEVQYAYFASDLFPHHLERDADEIIEVEPLTSNEVEDAIARGVICDCKSIAIYFKAKMQGLL